MSAGNEKAFAEYTAAMKPAAEQAEERLSTERLNHLRKVASEYHLPELLKDVLSFTDYRVIEAADSTRVAAVMSNAHAILIELRRCSA